MIGITGATGALSSAVLTRLAKTNQPVRLLARNTEKASSFYRAQSPRGSFDARICDYSDTQACREALEGVDTVLFVSSTEHPDRLQQHRSFVDALVAAGVKTVIYTSFRRAAPDAIFHHARDHYWTEEYIKDKGSLEYVFLRNAFYQDVLPFFVTDGAIRGPAGSGTLSPVAREDIAAVITSILSDPQTHARKTYELTGPEDLTFAQISAMLGVQYVDESMEEAKASRRAPNVEDWLIDAWISTYTAVRDGEEAGVTEDVKLITGRPATRLQETLKATK